MQFLDSQLLFWNWSILDSIKLSNFSGLQQFQIFHILLYFLTFFTFLFFPFSQNLYCFLSIILAVWSLVPLVKTESKKAFCSSASSVSLAIIFPSATSSEPMCPLIFLIPLMPPQTVVFAILYFFFTWILFSCLQHMLSFDIHPYSLDLMPIFAVLLSCMSSLKNWNLSKLVSCCNFQPAYVLVDFPVVS